MIKEFLIIIGAGTIMVMISFAIIVIIDAVKEMKRKLMLKYKQKHRFDKPPTAKCYCVDCIHHDNKTGRCYYFENWNTADCWFCWKATPIKKEAEQE